MSYTKPGTSSASPISDCFGQAWKVLSTTLGDSGDTLANWSDATGNGNHISQSNIGSVPIVCDGASDGSANVVGSNAGVFISQNSAGGGGCSGLLTYGIGLSIDPGNFTMFVVWEPMGVQTDNVSGASQFGKYYLSSSVVSGKQFQWQTFMPTSSSTTYQMYLGNAQQLTSPAPKLHFTNRQVWALRSNQTDGQSLWINGVKISTANHYFTGGGTANNISIWGVTDGLTGGQKQPEGKLLRVTTYSDGTITDTEMGSIFTALESQHNVVTSFNRNLIFVGDSKVFGQNSTRGLNWSRYLSSAFPSYRIYNVATPSQQAIDLDTDYAALVTPLKDGSNPNILILSTGYNDIWLGSRTASQVWTSLSSIISKAKSDGFTVVICTLDGGTGSVSVTSIDGINQQILTNAPAVVDGLVRIDQIQQTGLFPSINHLKYDRTYFENMTEPVHPTSLAYGLQACAIAAKVAAPIGIPLASNVKKAISFGPDANGNSTGTLSREISSIT